MTHPWNKGKNMRKRIVIIGAVALGPKVAARLRRLDPDVQITVVDRDNLISYGGCGIPYYVGGDIADIEGLCSTSFHVVRDAKFFRDSKGVNVLTGVEAVSINRKEKKIDVQYMADGKKDSLEYDKLVIATGATPFTPPIPGVDLPMVFSVANLHSAKAIKDTISKGMVENAVVVGAGAIGIEMAEALTDLWGIKTTIVEMADQVLPMALGKNISRIVENTLKESDVDLLLSEKLVRINGDAQSGVTSVETTGGQIECDMVILSAGIRPNTKFASDAGLAVGRSGGLLVDSRMRTTDPDIYAGGDCVEVKNLVSGENMMMPLGSLANRQGRIIADNIHGRPSQFKGMVGTFCIKVFDSGVATAGLTVDQARRNGFDPVHAMVSQPDRAHFYPTASMMYIELIADRNTRKVLGIEAVGSQGDAVKARVDAVAPLLQSGITVDDICTLEVGYAPPFASAMDIINNAGNVLDNILEGGNKPMDALEFFEKFANDEIKVIDVRQPKEVESCIERYKDKWGNIPQSELKKRLDEIPKDEPVCLVCGTGARSYECQRLLNHNGFVNVRNVQGGHTLLVALNPEFF